MSDLRTRTQEITAEYWAAREMQSERVAVAQVALALARSEAAQPEPVGLRAALDTLDGLATAVIRMKLAIPAKLGPPVLPAAFFAALGDVNQWLDKNDQVQSRAALASPSPEPLDEAWKAAEAALPDGWVIGHVQRNSQHGHPKGQAWSASCYRETGDPLPLTGHIGKGRWPDRRQIAYGPTPAAALRALAARLSEDPR